MIANPRSGPSTLITFVTHGVPVRHENSRVVCKVKLGRQESHRICLKVAPIADGEVQEPVYGCDAFRAVADATDKARRTWVANATRLRTSNPHVQLAWDRAVTDLGALASWSMLGWTVNVLTHVPSTGSDETAQTRRPASGTAVIPTRICTRCGGPHTGH